MFGQLLGVPAIAGEGRQRLKSHRCVIRRQGGEEAVKVWRGVFTRAGGDQLIERTEGVTSRPPTKSHGGVNQFITRLETGGVLDVLQQCVQGVATNKSKFEVLGAAANRGQHLVRVGGGQHEDNMGGGFLERLQQGRGGRLGQLVDLVEDVDLPATRRPVPSTRGDVSNVFNPIVRRGV
jgi:hypothetical protein